MVPSNGQSMSKWLIPCLHLHNPPEAMEVLLVLQGLRWWCQPHAALLIQARSSETGSNLKVTAVTAFQKNFQSTFRPGQEVTLLAKRKPQIILYAHCQVEHSSPPNSVDLGVRTAPCNNLPSVRTWHPRNNLNLATFRHAQCSWDAEFEPLRCKTCSTGGTNSSFRLHTFWDRARRQCVLSEKSKELSARLCIFASDISSAALDNNPGGLLLFRLLDQMALSWHHQNHQQRSTCLNYAQPSFDGPTLSTMQTFIRLSTKSLVKAPVCLEHHWNLQCVMRCHALSFYVML